ncbi:substrate-binding periplasmic protein [Pseudoduganella violaceinigra]|uniref:substrate-binding periplasmic protein n=1 Tax=Pseudoduganella violaceinigra TaxID=246602 RepID=UPI0004049062|nr:transporter substrate-binding domain-containing protein [Pseudoduganella violaceinigra]
MKLFLALLLLLPLPLWADGLRLSVIAHNPTHEEVWRVVQAAAQRAGIPAQARAVPAERALALANSGATDGDVGRIEGLDQQYRNLVRVPEPVYHYSAFAFALTKLDVGAGWDDLRGHTVCIRRGIKLFELRTGGMRRQLLDDEVSVMRMLRSGGCELALLEPNNPAVKAEMAAHPPLYQLQPPLEVTPLYLYLHKRHAGLVPRFAEALKQMRQDGTLQKILND